VIELDLNGHRLSVREQDLRWLGAQAASAAGSSSPASELASRLAAPSCTRRLFFAKAEARALLTVLSATTDPPPGLRELQEVLQEAFSSTTYVHPATS
jgi:hypothetical protein